MSLSIGTVLKGIQVWRALKPFKRWKERRRRKREGELTSELIALDMSAKEQGMGAYNKLWVMLVGGVLSLASHWFPGLESADAEMLVQAVFLALTAVGVYSAPNKAQD